MICISDKICIKNQTIIFVTINLKNLSSLKRTAQFNLRKTKCPQEPKAKNVAPAAKILYYFKSVLKLCLTKNVLSSVAIFLIKHVRFVFLCVKYLCVSFQPKDKGEFSLFHYLIGKYIFSIYLSIAQIDGLQFTMLQTLAMALQK